MKSVYKSKVHDYNKLIHKALLCSGGSWDIRQKTKVLYGGNRMDKMTKILTVAAVLVLLLGAGIWAIVLNNGKTNDAGIGVQGSLAAENSTAEGTSDEPDSMEASGGGADAVKGTVAAQIEEAAETDWVEISLADGVSSAGSGVSVEGDKITIEKGGYYRVSGSLTNGRLLVKAGEDEEVVLSLSGISITNETEEALRVKTAGSVIVYLAEGTDNVLTTGAAADITENPNENGMDDADASEDTEDADTGAALHSKVDMIICGGGSLMVNGYINNGIQVNTTLTIEGGILNVQAVNNGIKGKAAVMVSGGSISVLSGNDGIKSDGVDEGQGNVSIAGGTINVTSYGDAVQADDTLSISAGMLELVTKGDTASQNSTGDGWGHGWGSPDGGWDMAAETDISTKGLKAGTLIEVCGGTINIDASDDALHSNGDVNITGGTLTLASGDDGIHADTQLTVSDGSVTITQSYEGLEANQLYIKGGDISVTASDDGLNASGGSSGFGFGWGASASAEDMANLCIQGGTLYVNAGGDGLDSNGNLYVEGGVIIVDGPSSSGNGALDSGSESGGVIRISGGTILAVGASGMAECFDEGSSQCSFIVNMGSSWQAGDTITITDEDGNVLFTHDAAKSGNCIVFSSAALEQGETYIVTAGGQTKSVSQNSVSAGSSGGGFGGGFGGGRGGFGR